MFNLLAIVQVRVSKQWVKADSAITTWNAYKRLTNKRQGSATKSTWFRSTKEINKTRLAWICGHGCQLQSAKTTYVIPTWYSTLTALVLSSSALSCKTSSCSKWCGQYDGDDYEMWNNCYMYHFDSAFWLILWFKLKLQCFYLITELAHLSSNWSWIWWLLIFICQFRLECVLFWQCRWCLYMKKNEVSNK